MARLGLSMPARDVARFLVDTSPTQQWPAVSQLEAALTGRRREDCDLPFGVPSDESATVAYVLRLLTRLWAVADDSATASQLRQLEDRHGTPLAVKIGIFQELARSSSLAMSAGSPGEHRGFHHSASHWRPSAQRAADPSSAHVAGKATLSPVAAHRLIHPTQAEKAWVTAYNEGDPMPPTPKAVVQYAMADEQSREELRAGGELAPQTQRALGADCKARRDKAARVAETVMGVDAASRLKKHLAAMLSGRLTMASKPADLACPDSSVGSLGVSKAGRAVTPTLVMSMNTRIMRAALPEFDWSPLDDVAMHVGRMLASPLPSVIHRA